MLDAAKLAAQWEPQVIEARRYLHAHPELADREVNTASYIWEQLSQYPSLTLSRPCPTGVVAVLKGAKPGRVYAARCDIDALPIEEYDDSPFKSQNPGVMHACGHDGNTAMLLTAAKILAEHPEEVSGTIKFIFQPSEEANTGGSIEMVQAGVVDDVDIIFGAHVAAECEPGHFYLRNGATHAAVYGIEILIHGIGGHGGFPYQCTDNVMIGAEIVCALNSIVAKNIDPCKSAVITITSFTASQANNIIPETVVLAGSARILNEEIEDLVTSRIRQIAEGICAAYGVTCEVHLDKGFGVVRNDDQVTDAVRAIMQREFGADKVTADSPVLGGEDFSRYLEKARGCYFKIGTRGLRDGVEYPHHHSRFCLNEDGLKYGVEAWLSILTSIQDELN